jgi:hypothetical protein
VGAFYIGGDANVRRVNTAVSRTSSDPTVFRRLIRTGPGPAHVPEPTVTVALTAALITLTARRRRDVFQTRRPGDAHLESRKV